MRDFSIVNITPSANPSLPSTFEISFDQTISFHGKEWIDELGVRFPYNTYSAVVGAANPPPTGTGLLLATTFEVVDNPKYNGRYTVYTKSSAGDFDPSELTVGGDTLIRVNESMAPGVGTELTTGRITAISTYVISAFGEGPILVLERQNIQNRPVELMGHRTTGWGEVFFQNQIDAAQNYAGPSAPTNPFVGQMWYDTVNDLLMIRQLTNTWAVVNSAGGGVGDETITTLKLVDEAVTTAKIADDAVVEAKLAPDAVTTPKIAAGAVTTPKIADDAVVSSKLASSSVTEVKLATGAVTEPKLGDSAVTTVKLADSAVTEPKLINSAVSTQKLADSAVTAVKLAADAVTTVKLVDSAVTEPKLATSAVTAVKLATDAVTTLKVLDGAITTPKLADNSVTGAKVVAGAISEVKLADSSVATAKIVDGNVTTPKLADDAVTTVKIADANITLAKMATASVGTNQLVLGAVTPDRITASSLSLISANLGTVTSGNLIIGTTPTISGTTMTGSGVRVNTDGTFALGTASKNIVNNGTNVKLNGFYSVATTSAGNQIPYNGPGSTDTFTSIFAEQINLTRISEIWRLSMWFRLEVIGTWTAGDEIQFSVRPIVTNSANVPIANPQAFTYVEKYNGTSGAVLQINPTWMAFFAPSAITTGLKVRWEVTATASNPTITIALANFYCMVEQMPA